MSEADEVRNIANDLITHFDNANTAMRRLHYSIQSALGEVLLLELDGPSSSMHLNSIKRFLPRVQNELELQQQMLYDLREEARQYREKL